MRERIDPRGVNRDVRVEEVREADPVRLGDETKERAVTVEGPGAPGLDQLQGRFFIPVDEAVADGAGGVFEGELRRLVAEPLALHDLGGPAGRQPLEENSRLKILKARHAADYTGRRPMSPTDAPDSPNCRVGPR